MIDPQNDWQEDGSCPECGGYASITGNGRDAICTVSCEGACGSFPAMRDAEDGQLVRLSPPPATPTPYRAPGPVEDAWSEDEPF